MKTRLTILLAFIAFNSLANQPDTTFHSGIYITVNDYKEGRLSYVDDKVRFNHFLCKNYITIVKKNSPLHLCKDSIYGYKDVSQNNYRFYNVRDLEYRILENKTIVIYSIQCSIPTSSGKGVETITSYYFSTGLNTPIVPLTVIGLKRAFPDNLKLHDKLDVEFYNKNLIADYDYAHKMYRVNYLLSQ